MINRLSPREFDKVVTFEALGTPYAVMPAQRRKVPLAIIRKRDSFAPNHLPTKVR